jgi:hypothetical protein
MKKYIIFLSLLLLPSLCFAGYSGSSPSWTSTADYTSLKGAYDSATEGDTINVSSDSATWTSGQTLTITKGIHIIGATTGCPDACVDETVITNGTVGGTYAALFVINPANPATTAVTEIEGLTLNLGDAGNGIWIQSTTDDYHSFRIHENHIYGGTSAGHYPVTAVGYTYGLLDHNLIEGSYMDLHISGNSQAGWDRYAESLDTDYSILWSALGMGGLDFLYIEDNVFSGTTHMIDDCGLGARWVFRYNSISLGSGALALWDIHGSTNNAGSIAVEIYENTETVPSTSYSAYSNYLRIMNFSGGTAMLYDNVVQAKPSGAGPLWDINIGASRQTDIACDYLRNGFQMKPRNSYFWGNTNSTSGAGRVYFYRSTSLGADPNSCLESGVHYWSDTNDNSKVEQTGYAFSKQTTAPATPVVGDVWWDTDDKLLYRCTAAGDWGTSVYTPLAYPHTLQGYTENQDENYYLTVTKIGAGDGTVTSSGGSGSIDCGDTCQSNFTNNDVVTLTATATGSDVFKGWSGEGCSGTGTCVVTMSAARNVVAEWQHSYVKSKAVFDDSGFKIVSQ